MCVLMPFTSMLCYSNPPQSVPCCIDYAKVRHGGSFHESAVDEIKVVCKIVLVFVSLVPYWTVYRQVWHITCCLINYVHGKILFYLVISIVL